MGIYHVSDFIRESRDKVYKHVFLTLLESLKHYHEWLRVHVSKEVKFKLSYELDKRTNEKQLQASTSFSC